MARADGEYCAAIGSSLSPGTSPAAATLSFADQRDPKLVTRPPVCVRTDTREISLLAPPGVRPRRRRGSPQFIPPSPIDQHGQLVCCSESLDSLILCTYDKKLIYMCSIQVCQLDVWWSPSPQQPWLVAPTPSRSQPYSPVCSSARRKCWPRRFIALSRS